MKTEQQTPEKKMGGGVRAAQERQQMWCVYDDEKRAAGKT